MERKILTFFVLASLAFRFAGATTIRPVNADFHTDGDEQFQAYHQDISRISASQTPVAAQTVVRQAPVAARAADGAPLSQQSQTSLRAQAHSRPNGAQGRVTLTMRTHAPVLPSASGGEELQASHPFASAPINEPLQAAEPVFTQLVAPPQFKPIGVSSSLSSTSSPFQPLEAPALRSAAHQVQPPSAPSVPALTSFRSGLSNSVSARHSALMAQVAAERQAAAAASPDFSQPQTEPRVTSFSQPQQPSLGSPLTALSQQAPLIQVQPRQQQHQAAASASLGFVNQPEEPLVAPSFEHVLSQGCPRRGVFSYENKDNCDKYYMCTNGTFTEEACPNGLAYSQMGAVYQYCAYNWNVDCGTKKTSEPLASPGCPWQFGIFPVSSAGRCSIDYFVCEWGVPETKRCQPEGLFYDDRIKGCQWADQLGCKSEALLNFKCPSEDEDNPYWPYPRYYHTKQDIIVCVSEQPRLVHCNEDQIVDPSSLACLDLKKKKKKLQ